MSVSPEEERTEQQAAGAAARCPIDHTTLSEQKTANPANRPGAAVECNEDGMWTIRGFEEARTVLRSGDTVQAGFGADMMSRVPGVTNTPILYLDGKDHHQQRRQTARFFAPKFVSDNYRPLMERLVAQLIAEAQRKRRFDLSDFSRTLAVRVAGEVVGLTNSIWPGMDRRLESFFHEQNVPSGPLSRLKWIRSWQMYYKQRKTLEFFYLDVRPAIRARKRRPQEDVISYLVTQHYNDREILTECVTYAAAGMVTTREFISVATWQLLEHPELRARYLVAPEEERYAILAEVLRLEPVVSHLYRRATREIELTSNGQTFVIPQDALLDIGIYGTNLDERVVEQPRTLCPGRELHGERVPHEMMSFGDGAHRCPGSSIAIQETDILLRQLLALEGLRMEHKPSVTWNNFTNGYELRDFVLVTG